ncbi:MAG TPA: ABC transporter permease [Thermoanaerobaculia bacterium]|nr:ABC transporter permease [Thermoanaerobaculia bacterium]
MLRAVLTLCRRELTRFFRQPSRIVGAAVTPLLFWLLIGSGFSGSFRMPGAPEGIGYLEYFFPGSIVLVLLFAAIFSNISVIEDRREGFLQGVLVAPVPRWVIVAGKVLGGAFLAWVQAVAFLALAPLTGIPLTVASAFAAAGVLALLAISLTAVGFAFAWILDSVQGFHAIMNILLMPMWLLSGSLFPQSGAPAWLSAVMRINPLNYGVAAFRGALYGTPAPLAVAVTLGLGIVAFAAGLFVTRGGRVE